MSKKESGEGEMLVKPEGIFYIEDGIERKIGSWKGWLRPDDKEPDHNELCLIFLEKNNCYDSVGLVQHYVGRYQKDQCDHFNKNGDRMEEHTKSYFDTNGGTVYHIDIKNVAKYYPLSLMG